jgi:hypothetical protein
MIERADENLAIAEGRRGVAVLIQIVFGHGGSPRKAGINKGGIGGALSSREKKMSTTN